MSQQETGANLPNPAEMAKTYAEVAQRASRLITGFMEKKAKDGVEALEAVADERPDLILTDIEMPRLDGFELLRTLQGEARWRDIPVIVITSRTADKHKRYAEEIGVNHYLGKPSVQNLSALRFGNALFEPLWRRESIANIQITLAESLGVGTRGDFYDRTGALRDMVQNHMLQLLALVAMEPPANYDATAIRDEKVKVLRALRLVAPDETVTGQYRAGAIGGQPVPGYDEELGQDSDTETFVAIKAHLDNWRWKGVPFYLRTGKRLPERKTEIVVQFRHVPHSIFAGKGALTVPNRLVIGIQPEENITLSLMAKVPGLDREGIRLREVPLDIAMADAFAGPNKRIAYERLLLDLIEGDQTLFVRRDEVEAQWDWIDAIRTGWTSHGVRPKNYTAGSWGPSSAIALTERDGVHWHE
jgi:glucose-6-phosphate 1-dehydrogenase